MTADSFATTQPPEDLDTVPAALPHPAAPLAPPPAGQSADGAAARTAAPLASVDLRSLRLRAGLALQVAVQGSGGPTAAPDLQFLAAIAGKGVMVGPAAEAAAAGAPPPRLTLAPGQEVTVRGFSGQHDFSFAARVLQTFVDPFVYALLSYPSQVQARQTRQALRLATALPARVQAYGAAAAEGMVIDLSPHGALLRTTTPVGRPDDVLTLTLQAMVDDRRLDLLLHARLRHTQPVADGHLTGVQFIGVQEKEWLILQAMCGGESAR